MGSVVQEVLEKCLRCIFLRGVFAVIAFGDVWLRGITCASNHCKLTDFKDDHRGGSLIGGVLLFLIEGKYWCQ